MGALNSADEALIAAKLSGQFGLGQVLPYPPLCQSHRKNPPKLDAKRYASVSYLVNGHCTFTNAEYAAMTYNVLVMHPGNRLREMRKRAGLDQAELAELANVEQSSISNWENGKRSLTVPKMRLLSRILGCTVADLLSEDDNPYRLAEDEQVLITDYREAADDQRELTRRVAAPVRTYRPPEAENEAA